jgi:citrate/tricarballylate utilization protein
MPSDQLSEHGAHVMTVCNACRYCEQYCPVFPAIERRRHFDKADLSYLANLCHNCGECLYACQYAPPHEFGIDVPRLLSMVRVRSYEDYGWPGFLASAYRRHSVTTAFGLAAALIAVMLGATVAVNDGALPRPVGDGDFYAVLPHEVMVLTFGGVFLFAVVALCVGALRFWRHVEPFAAPGRWEDIAGAFRDALTLRHLHPGGEDCTSAEETRTPWRRRLHHCTLYGFALCAASTSVAAIYHSLFGWPAPYAYTSLPVALGTVGGVLLMVGSGGLWVERRRGDPSLRDPSANGADESFLALLFLSAFTGLLLLALRERAVMSSLLIVHLGVVLALFLTLPYGKFVHAIYRTAALVKSAKEGRADSVL